MSTDILQWLQTWYAANCDGDWEENFGVKIGTLDNPGWSLEIDVTDDLPLGFERSGKTDRTDDDWIWYEVKEEKFRGFGGPRNLTELLTIFRDLVEQHKS